MADFHPNGTATPHGLETELGRRLARIRLARNVTQKTLAREAGIGLRTLRRVEAGQSSTLESFLRIAIALDLANAVLSSIPSHDIRPIERVDSRRSERKRARPPTSGGVDEPWSWGDESRD